MQYKTIFIIDPLKSDRLYLAKFIKQENFTIMGFTNLTDCQKKSTLISGDLIIYVLRKGRTEIKTLINRAKDKALPYILLTTGEVSEVNLEELRGEGFTSLYKAHNHEKVREVAYGLLAPEGLKPREEKPHPIPIPFL